MTIPEEKASEYRITYWRLGLHLSQFEVKNLWRVSVFMGFFVYLMTVPQQNS
jgi:hypothetical protein